MTFSDLVFIVGTLLSWVGWYLAFRAVVIATDMFIGRPSVGSKTMQQRLLWSACPAGLALAIGGVLPMKAGSSPGVAWRFPLFWTVMPYTAWLGLACAAMVIVRAVQAWLGLNGMERAARLKAAGFWALGAALCIVLYGQDPGSKITVLKGGISMSPTTVVSIVLLAAGAIVAMTLAGRATASRGLAKSVVTQAMLVAGSLVFGLPFAFLLVTSFKEDRDMSSPNGIVWVPRVQDTKPYFDPLNPTYQGTYKGTTVQGVVIAHQPNGDVRIDIAKPLAIRGVTFDTPLSALKVVPTDAPVVTASLKGMPIEGMVVKDLDDGRKQIQVLKPPALKGQTALFLPGDVQPVRHIGLKLDNYPEALSYLPPETDQGLVYLKNTLIIVVLSVIGTILSSSVVAYAFSRMKFPGRDALFMILLSTMMLPGAVTLMPQFLIFRQLGWIDTLYPLWVPAFFASAFNVFLLRQFFMQVPMELEDAAKIDGCSYLKTYWNIMMPQIQPALAVIAIWTFLGAWNNFMGPLIYINSPENMPLSYALQLFQGDRSGEPGLLMAFATLCMLPVLLLFFFAQKYFIEGVTLSGFGGR